MATNKVLYHGFSSANWLANKKLGVANFHTVKSDLMNHIFTPIGSRLMMPSFGTRIPLMCFEPNDEQTRQIIYDDINTVIEYDPRVKLIALEVIVAFCDVNYIEFKVTDTLHIDVPTAG